MELRLMMRMTLRKRRCYREEKSILPAVSCLQLGTSAGNQPEVSDYEFISLLAKWRYFN